MLRLFKLTLGKLTQAELSTARVAKLLLNETGSGSKYLNISKRV